jgi:oxygen-dependent protoporphyrinogen oxidase
VAALSLPAVFPKLWEWEQSGGSLFKGAKLAQQKARQASRARRAPMQLLSFEGGLGTLPTTLAMALPPEQLLYGRSVTQLEAGSAAGYRVHTHTGEVFDCQHLILATPAPTASQLLHSLCPQASQALGQISYNSLSVTHFGFPQSAIPHPLDGFGCLVPQREKLPLLGVIWASSLFPERAPADQVLLSCFAGGAHHPELFGWPSEAIQQLVLDNLKIIFKTPQALQPSFRQTLRYEKAIPQYTLGHRERIQITEAALAEQHPNIQMCGNHLHGIALNECVRSGQTAAHRILSA